MIKLRRWDFIMNIAKQTMKETHLFSELANRWWDESGPFGALHRMNPLRMQFMLHHIRYHFNNAAPIKVLDIGCGGGLVCEPFARLGYHVTGIDQSSEAIQVAQHHAKEHNLDITYECKSATDLHETYDVITILEVLEHVSNPEALLCTSVERLNEGGLIFFSTLNRTAYSYVAGILLAERVLKWAPKGTHKWGGFLKPSEIILPLNTQGVQIIDIAGITYSPLNQRWQQSNSLKANYIGVGVKKT